MKTDLFYKWYLESVESDSKIYQTLKFDKEETRRIIIRHLSDYPKDTLLWYKVNEDEEYVGDDLIGSYSVNPKNNTPSKEIQKGNNLYYKGLL